MATLVANSVPLVQSISIAGAILNNRKISGALGAVAALRGRSATGHGQRIEVSAQEAAQLLQAPWPGNVRQLINLAERAVLQSRRGEGTIASLLMNDHEDMQPVTASESGDNARNVVMWLDHRAEDQAHRINQILNTPLNQSLDRPLPR